MATIGKRRMTVAGMIGGGEFPVARPLREASGQSYALGELVIMSSGEVAIAGADPAAVLGIAEKAASGTQHTEVPVALNTENVIFEANLLGSAAGDYTLLQADIGKLYGVARDATPKRWYIDSSETSATRVRIIGVAPGSAIGDVNARVLFVFMAATRTGAGSLYA